MKDDPEMSGHVTQIDPVKRIERVSGKRSGQACIRGLRITVKDILEYLGSGMSQEEVLNAFPDLERADIVAACAYAAEHLTEE
jgi:uncharacterized protein (DUF433 family)